MYDNLNIQLADIEHILKQKDKNFLINELLKAYFNNPDLINNNPILKKELSDYHLKKWYDYQYKDLLNNEVISYLFDTKLWVLRPINKDKPNTINFISSKALHNQGKYGLELTLLKNNQYNLKIYSNFYNNKKIIFDDEIVGYENIIFIINNLKHL